MLVNIATAITKLIIQCFVVGTTGWATRGVSDYEKRPRAQLVWTHTHQRKPHKQREGEGERGRFYVANKRGRAEKERTETLPRCPSSFKKGGFLQKTMKITKDLSSLVQNLIPNSARTQKRKIETQSWTTFLHIWTADVKSRSSSCCSSTMWHASVEGEDVSATAALLCVYARKSAAIFSLGP